MTTATNAIHLLDVVRVFNDPHLPVRTTEQVQALHTFISRFMHELQAADGAALGMVVNLCRQIDADYDGYRDHLRSQLQVLDLIQEIRSAEDVDQARLLAELKLQLDRIEETTETIQGDVAASGQAARKKIDPNSYYSYDEASEAVGVSKSTLHRQVAKGKLRTVHIGKLVRFVGSDLLAYQRGRGGSEVRVLGA